MSTFPQLRVGDIGKTIRVHVRNGTTADEDLSSATTLTMKFRKPSGSVVTRDAVLTNTGVDGRAEYVTIAGDLDESGSWNGQLYVVTPSLTYHTTVFAFQVGSNLS